MSFPRVIVTTVVVLLLAAASAGANTLNYSGTSDSTDPSFPFIPVSFAGATTCAQPPTTLDLPDSVRYDVYAFRNASTSSDCITVTGSNPDCATNSTYDVTLASDQSILGIDGNCDGNSHTYSFTAAAGQMFYEFVYGQQGDSLPYGLSVSGTDVVPVHVAIAAGPLPASNTLSLNVTSLEDGSDVQGTLTDDAGSGHHYGGPVRCLRISGSDASLVMTFDGTEQGLAPQWKGAVYWLHSSADGNSDGQRNSLLTQSQLDGKYANCPDPTKPVGGSFKTFPNNGAVTVIANGPQTAAG